MVMRDLTDPATTREVLADCDEGVRRSRTAGDLVLEARHTYLRGAVLAFSGRVDEGERTARRAQQMARTAGIPRDTAWATWVLAVCRYKRGDLDGAQALFTQAQRDWHADREASVELLALIGQVLVATDRQEEHQARAALLALLDLWPTTGRSPHSAERVLEPFAYFAASSGDFGTVVRICSALNRHGHSIGILTRFGRDIAEQLAQARLALGEQAASAAWAEGQTLPLEDLCTLARSRCTTA
jgi:tetratricopeptide (TPR) repeat protein